jgi:hypothetical protein
MAQQHMQQMLPASSELIAMAGVVGSVFVEECTQQESAPCTYTVIQLRAISSQGLGMMFCERPVMNACSLCWKSGRIWHLLVVGNPLMVFWSIPPL